MLQTSALPLGYVAKLKWSGRRDSNSRPSPWQGDALPLSHSRIWCPEAESNHRHEDFQSSALPTELSGHIKNINFQIAHSLVLCTRLRHCLKTTSLFLPLPYTDFSLSGHIIFNFSKFFEFLYLLLFLFQIAHSLVLCTKLRHCLKTTLLFLPLPYTDYRYLGI